MGMNRTCQALSLTLSGGAGDQLSRPRKRGRRIVRAMTSRNGFFRSQFRQAGRNRGYRRKALSVQHPVWKLDAQLFFEREHKLNHGKGSEPRAEQIRGVVERRGWHGKSAMLIKGLPDKELHLILYATTR
jgi:hypothetical protein